jgi:hypothetical protein
VLRGKEGAALLWRFFPISPFRFHYLTLLIIDSLTYVIIENGKPRLEKMPDYN